MTESSDTPNIPENEGMTTVSESERITIMKRFTRGAIILTEPVILCLAICGKLALGSVGYIADNISPNEWGARLMRSMQEGIFNDADKIMENPIVAGNIRDVRRIIRGARRLVGINPRRE